MQRFLVLNKKIIFQFIYQSFQHVIGITPPVAYIFTFEPLLTRINIRFSMVAPE